MSINMELKASMLQKLEDINKVEGFNPEVFSVEYTDLNTGEVRKRLPVMIQMAWFRMKYPEGRISVQVTPVRDYFVATARIYPSYKDAVECYLAEATASRGPDPNKPSVSPREWAQTAAVGIALRNAGFGLQFSLAGDEPEGSAVNETGAFLTDRDEGESNRSDTDCSSILEPMVDDLPTEENEILTEEQILNQAMAVPCPIKKYQGKTLGNLIELDPKALSWVANKFTGNLEIREAAMTICEYALKQETA